MTRCGKIFMYCAVLLLLVLSSTQLASSTSAQVINQQFDRDKPTVDAPEAFVTVAGTKLHYVASGSGRTVVLIHGNAGDAQDFDFGTRELLARNYRVIAFDLPGHGLSTMPGSASGTIQEQAVILHQALAAMRVADPILVGHSWGGAIALAYAVLYPLETSALVLLAPAAYSDHRHDAPLLLRIPVLSDVCLALFKPTLGRKLLKQGLKEAFAPDPVPDEYFKAVASVWLDRKHLKAFIKHDLMLESSLTALSPDYQKIRERVVIVTGDSDRAVSPQQNAFNLNRAIANSQLIVIPGAGHQIPELHPEAVLRAVNMAAYSAPQTAANKGN